MAADLIARGSLSGYRFAWEPLPWSPPTLTAPLTVNVDQYYANRFITLNAGQDLILNLGNVSTQNNLGTGGDAMVQVTGGRHVVVIGGNVTVPDSPQTSVTTAANATDDPIYVASTAGFPATGQLRIDGEFIRYTGLTTTSFTGLTRNTGFYNSSVVSSTSHTVGAIVYLAESYRSPLSFLNQTGTVHVEGVNLDGRVNDGIRFASTSATAIMQVQNCRIGPVVNYDTGFATDGHPDCIQAWAGGGTLRVARCTFLATNGRAINNTSGDSGNTPLTTIETRNIDAIGYPGHGVLLLNSYPGSTSWAAMNTWVTPNNSSNVASSDVLGKVGIQPYPADTWTACPAGRAGVNYASPGYYGI